VTYYLAKTDPETYSVDDLERERRTVWDGVKNPQALRAIAAMKPGDRVFIYHSMGDAAVMGLAKVASAPRPDSKNPKLTVVELEFLRRLRTPVTLREIKESGKFNDWALVRQSRLSTMAAPDAFVGWLREKGEKVG
jgi:predicted RNA-binding protein with PUA-like domain